MADFPNAVVEPIPAIGPVPVSVDPYVVTTGYEILSDKTAIGGSSLSYVNRAYDSVASGTVTWITTNAPDMAGASYPGPGVFGVDTSNVTIESVVDSTLL